jgi:integrase/recombinase XerD
MQLWVTLVKQQGVQDTEIMKVTGHTSSEMVYAYDKISAEDNQTKRIILIRPFFGATIAIIISIV